MKTTNAWLIEIDHTAASGKGYTMKTVYSFKDAKAEADRISKCGDVYLVSLYRFTNNLIIYENVKEPRKYIQRNGGKLHSANSAYYRKWESPAHMSGKFLLKLKQYKDEPEQGDNGGEPAPVEVEANSAVEISAWYPSMIDVYAESEGYNVKRFCDMSSMETECSPFGEPLIFPSYQSAKTHADKLNYERTVAL